MKKVLLLYTLAVLCSVIKAQSDRLSLDLQHVPFREFVELIETEMRSKIFYAEEWIDSLYINVHSENEPIQKILDKALTNSDLTYLIIDDKYIVLSKGYTIKSNFQQEYKQYLMDNLHQTNSIVYAVPISIPEEEKYISDEYKVFKIGNPMDFKKKGNVVLSGTIQDALTGLPIVGAIVYIKAIQKGAVSDMNGFYSLVLPRGKFIVEYRSVGLRTARRNLIVYSSGEFNIEMYEEIKELEEVTVVADQENKVKNLRMGTEKISIKMLKQIPMGIGEVDVLKSSLLLPGVQSVGEASAGYNVRGGSTDQNLMLLNDAPIINPSHFFGFFSTFNSDIIGDITLYKSGIPASYGGRISSVMDIRLKEGNKERFKVSGGISPVTGRILIEGPIEDRTSYILSARATYSDWILRQLIDKQLQRSSASFYDLQGMITSAINQKNKISLSGYYSEDKFDFYKQSTFNYSNFATTLQWHHSFTPNLFANFSAILSNYHYQINNIQNPYAINGMYYGLNQRIAKADFSYIPSKKHNVNLGFTSTLYNIAPGEQLPLNDSSYIKPKKLEEEQALESSFYLSDNFIITPAITLSGGLRYNLYASIGPGKEFTYAENFPLSPSSIQDTLYFSKDQIKASYQNLEFRISSRFLLGSAFSIKAGVQRMYQYIYMISNTTAISPTDIWKLCDNHIKPQRSDQYSIGLYKNFRRNTIEASVEAYYKKLNNIIDYKGGAQLLMNEYLETVILNGMGKAYGIELMTKKEGGSITGWISYTYSRIFHKVDGEFAEEKINDGNYFPATYDKPHDLKLVVNSKLSRRFNTTVNFVYTTGRPITYPVGYFNFSDNNRVFYSDRNEFRIPDYIRLDLAATLNGNLKARKLNHSSFTFAIYNVLGRRNPYSIYFKFEDGEVKGYQMSIFGKPIFTITYNFKILGNASDDF